MLNIDWKLARMGFNWFLILNGTVVAAARWGKIYSPNGELLHENLSLREYSAPLGVPAELDIHFTLPAPLYAQCQALSAILDQIPSDPNHTRRPRRSPVVTAAKKPTAVAVSPVVEKPVVPPTPKAPDLEQEKRRAEERQFFFALIRRVASEQGYEILPMANLLLVEGNDDVGRRTKAVALGDGTIKAYEPPREQTPGMGTKARNEWFAKKLRRQVAEASYVELQQLQVDDPSADESPSA